MEMARVVVLDDDASVADLLKALVEESGHTTIAARDLAQVPADTQADLVVSDLLPLKAYRRDAALAWVQQLRDRFAAPFPIGDTELAMTASIGISIAPIDATDASTLLRNADTAMYRSKQTGGGEFVLYA